GGFGAGRMGAGWPAVGDCAGATFTAQGLVQLRDALHADKRARGIPPEATQLTLEWTEDEQNVRTVTIAHAAPSDFLFGYGFQVSFESVSTPAIGSHSVPGENVLFLVTFRD